MVKIETEFGTFEADTEKEAMKAMAKGKRAHQKAEAERQERCKLACLRADSMAYRIMRTIAKGETFGRGWRLHTPGHSYSAAKTSYEGTRQVTTFMCQEGTFADRFYGYTVVSAITNGCGWAVGFFLREDATGETVGYAVGAEGDAGAWVEVPGLTEGHFQREESSAVA